MKPLSEEEIAEGWIAHDGGECPVDDDVMIQTILLDGTKGAMGNANPANWWTWSRNTCYPIIAYRVVDQGEALKAAVDEGVDKMGDERLPRFHKLGMRYEEQNKAMGDDKPAKDLRQLGRFSHHDTKYTTHVFYDEHPIAMITDDVISWSYHMPDMKRAASEAMHVYLGRVWK